MNDAQDVIPVDIVGRDQVLNVADARDATEQVEALARVGSDGRLLGGRWLVIATAKAHLRNNRVIEKPYGFQVYVNKFCYVLSSTCTSYRKCRVISTPTLMSSMAMSPLKALRPPAILA